jgi:DNA-binding transcriptional MerR regulator
MLIGELVEKSGLSRDTIRFYERKGLIALGKKSRRVNNYKEYSDKVLEKLTLIKKLKGLGFTLNEIDTFFELWRDEDANCQTLKFTLEDKLRQISEQLIRLSDLQNRVAASLGKCNSDDCEFEQSVPSCICK